MAPARPHALPRTRAARAVAVAIATLELGAAPVRAAPSAPSSDDVVTTAEAAFDVGLARWRRGNYGGAVEAWTRAHRLLARSDEIGMQRILGFDLAQAHMRVFVVDRDPTHLAAARRLLEDYVLWIERPGHARSRQEDSDREHALELLAIVEIEQAAQVSPVPPPIQRTPDARTPPPVPPGPTELKRVSNGLIIGGSVSLGVAIVLAGALGALVENRPKFGDTYGAPRPGGGAIAASAVGMSLFALAGAGMLTAGLLKRKALLSVHPTLARRQAGIVVGVAF